MKVLPLIKFKNPQNYLLQVNVLRKSVHYFTSEVDSKSKQSSSNTGIIYFGIGAAVGAEEWYKNYSNRDAPDKKFVKRKLPLDDLRDDFNKILSRYDEEHEEYGHLFEENVLLKKERDALLATFTLERERWIQEHAETFSNLETTTISLKKTEQELGAKTQLYEELNKLYEQSKEEISHWRHLKEHVEGEFSTTRKDLEYKIKELESRTPTPLIFGTGLIFGIVAAGLVSLFFKS